ncbi:MAG: NUDIX domain-containing protein [Bacteroidota bacterium]
MNFEPQKFFIGLMDFFTILLPGALASFLLMDCAPVIIDAKKYSALSVEAKWMVFFVSSYFLGHFIFLIGAILMDEHVYDNLMKFPLKKQVNRLAKGGLLSPKWMRSLAGILIKPHTDEPRYRAIQIKEHYLESLNSSSAMNAFQWCKARLTDENPEAMAIVQRFEADSKFFRSLTVILTIFLFVALCEIKLLTALITLLLIVLALWRYIDQRLKSVTQAYWYIITMEAKKTDASEVLASPNIGVPTHAGGVVYKKENGTMKFLFVRASKSPFDWVLPKGHIEPEETWEQTAVREVREETGIWACFKAKLNHTEYSVAEKTLFVQFYLMKFLEEGKVTEQRETMWLDINEAIDKASQDETKDILRDVKDKWMLEILNNEDLLNSLK